MVNVKKLVKQLQKERDKVEKQLHGLNAALTAFAKVYTGKIGTRRKLSAKARARIAAAQKRRWAAWKAKKGA